MRAGRPRSFQKAFVTASGVPSPPKPGMVLRSEGENRMMLPKFMQDTLTISVQENQAKPRKAYWGLACLLAALGFHIAVVLPMINVPTNPMDEGMVLVYPELLSKGIIAHRDFESLYPPGNIWFLAGAYKLLGTDMYVERSVGILYQFLLLTGIFLLFRFRGNGVAVAGCILSTIVMIRLGVIALAWIGGLAWGVWSLAILTRPGNPRTRGILAGIFAGLSVTWRADIAPALILSIGAYCILEKWRWRDFRWLVLAGGITLIPLMIHATIVTPSVFFDNVFYTPIIRTHHGRGLPLNYSNAYSGELYALIVIGFMTALIVGWAGRSAVAGEWTALLVAGLFTLGVFPQALQRADVYHLSYVAAFSVPLLVLTGSFISRNRMMPLLLLGAVLLAMPQAVGTVFSAHSTKYGTFWVFNGDRMIGTSFPAEQVLVDYLKANAKPNESLFVGTKDMRFTFSNDVRALSSFPVVAPGHLLYRVQSALGESPQFQAGRGHCQSRLGDSGPFFGPL